MNMTAHNKLRQKQIWKDFWENQPIHADIKEYHWDIKRIIEKMEKHTSIEIGCGIGLTSLILPEQMECTLLDFDAGILRKASAIFEQKHRKANFICCDMFNLDSVDEKYDMVFNSGVLEHYTFAERRKLLMEYQKVLHPDGVMLIAVPNHYCIPYKIGYTVLRLLGRWKYPKEYAIKDMVSELQGSGLKQQQCIIAANHLIERSLPWGIIRKVYACFRRIFGLQGYLRVFIITS
jgi:2-polyprenyl-3-methyl-5-hydroxy-6-metoxy-1,4-benzoquinol methylase